MVLLYGKKINSMTLEFNFSYLYKEVDANLPPANGKRLRIIFYSDLNNDGATYVIEKQVVGIYTLDDVDQPRQVLSVQNGTKIRIEKTAQYIKCSWVEA